jgi:hypothetical protein
MSKMYKGTGSLFKGLPVPNDNADRNSNFRSGRSANAIQPNMLLMRPTERLSKLDMIWTKTLS